MKKANTAKRGRKALSLKQTALSALPGAERMNACYNCGICASGCPASALSDLDPRKFLRLILLERDDLIFASDWVWMCTTCNRCLHACPMGIDIPKLIYTARNRWPRDKRPQQIVDYCEQAKRDESGAARPMVEDALKTITQKRLADLKQRDGQFASLNAPIDKKGATFFLNQSCESLLEEPHQMEVLWKILDAAGADWTYSTRSWAAENYCLFLAENRAWKELVIKKKKAVENLECSVLLNTECGHDHYAVTRGIEKFNIPHDFKVQNIIEYYAAWIREGKLAVNSKWNIDLKIKFTVQDPCQLVRKSYGDYIARQLRYVIEETVGEGNFIDMSPNCSNNYCCGGGGGAIRTDFVEQRLAYGKIKLDQIMQTGASFCITPCNNCYSQISDLSDHYGADFKTVHLWTVLAMAMGLLDPVEALEKSGSSI